MKEESDEKRIYMPQPMCQGMCYVLQAINTRIRTKQYFCYFGYLNRTRWTARQAGTASLPMKAMIPQESFQKHRAAPWAGTRDSQLAVLDESPGRSSEGGSGSARSMATVPGSQWCSGMDQGYWPELKAAAELLGPPITVTYAILLEMKKVKSSLHRNKDVNQRLAVHTYSF